MRQPAIFLPHGGGPWPFVDLRPLIDERSVAGLRAYLEALPAQLPERPAALLVVSAHWEAPVPTVMTSARPPMLYDYYGFPPAAYEIQWPAPGAPALAARVRGLLSAAGIDSAEDATRGFDHGTFVPLAVAFPDADVPALQLSLDASLDPARHLAIGRALAPLRDEGVLIVGSGMSFHDLRAFRAGRGRAAVIAEAFDAALGRVVTAAPATRDAGLTRWAALPSARDAHPREEHLLPLMVAAGAAGADRGRVTFNDTFGGVRVSAVQFSG